VPNKSTIDKLASLLDTAPYAVIIGDPKGRMLFINKFAMQLYGDIHKSKSPQDWPTHATAFSNGEKLKPNDYPLIRALKGELVSEMELDVVGHDTGKRFVIAVTAHPLHEDGELIGAMSIHRLVKTKKKSGS